ncbi:MAG: hypothetical protein ACFCUR_12245 [Rhodomicrobiaceae bacterium]
MKQWPLPDVQGNPKAVRLAVLLASLIGTLVIANFLEWGFLGAVLLAVIIAPVADLIVTRLLSKR